MCVIICMQAGQVFPYEKFENAVYNNEHGFGMLIKDDDKINVIRKHLEHDMDPKKLYKLVESHKDKVRVIHLRNNTAGDMSLSNVHPFKVYERDGEKIFFMHNGTHHSYRDSTTYVNGKLVPSQKESDSKRFADEFLSPLLGQMANKAGKFGDYFDKFFINILMGEWTTNCRGILVSNKKPHLFLNSNKWEKVTYSGQKFNVSNDTYFDKLTRGTEHKRRQDETRKKQEEARKNNLGGSSVGNNVTPLTSLNINQREALLTKELEDIWTDTDLWDDGSIAYLAAVTTEEWDSFVIKTPTVVGPMLSWLSEAYAEVYDNFEDRGEMIDKLEEKLKRASKLIGELRGGTNG